MLFARKIEATAATAILSIVFVPRAAYSQNLSKDDDRIQSELSAIGKRGETIKRVREQTLAILQTENGCSAWFQEADPDAAAMFGSLHYEIEEDKPSYVFRMPDGHGRQLFKHPWGARSTENGGRNSTVGLNPNGAFFISALPVMELDRDGKLVRFEGFHSLGVASFWGNSTGAQTIMLLHELGHIIGRLPEDDDSWDGRSSLNTKEVLRHCGQSIRAGAHGAQRGGSTRELAYHSLVRCRAELVVR
jgi:hypothetical protein